MGSPDKKTGKSVKKAAGKTAAARRSVAGRKLAGFSFMTSDLIRGHTETIILANLLKDDTYGYEINKRIQALTGNLYELKEATLYSAFKRLEMAGLIKSYWGDQESGARRKYYSITDEGRSVYWQSKVDWEKAKELIDGLIKEFNV